MSGWAVSDREHEPGFIVRLDSEKHIDLARGSSLAGGRPGRTKRRRLKSQKEKKEGGEEN